MGFISDTVRGTKAAPSAVTRGQATWREIFKDSSKEDRQKQPPVEGTHNRSTIATGEAYKRLLQAMRSRAPGGWSQDRYEQTRHFRGIQYVAIHRCGEQMAQAEFQVFKKDPTHPDGKRPITEEDTDAWALVQLLERPNNDDSFGEMMYMWNQQLDLTGMALTWMVPNQLGVPYEIYPIPTALAIPQPAIDNDYPHGFYRIQPVYPYGPFSSYPTPSSAVGAPIPAQWMLRFKYPHPLLRYEGMAPTTALELHIDEVESMDKSRFHSMKKSINPSAVLQMDEMEGMEGLSQSEIDRVRAEFEEMFQGVDNHGALIIAPPGGKLDQFGQRPIDMDYQAGWDQLTSFVLGGFGITKPAAGMVEDSSYSTLFATLKQLYWLTLEPKCNRIAAKLTRHLAPYFGDNLIIEIRCKRIDDHEVRNGKLEKLMTGKAITKNELRKELEMPLTQEAWGEEIAGVESPQEQPGMEGGLPGQEMGQEQGEGENPLAALFEDVPEEAQAEPGEVSGSRDDAGEMAQGAMNPRKSYFTKRPLKGVVANGRSRRS